MKRLALTLTLLALAAPLHARSLDITARYGWIDLSGDTTIENTDPGNLDNVDIEFDSETGYGLAVNLFLGNRKATFVILSAAKDRLRGDSK